MADYRINEIDENEIDTILAEDIHFTGELSFSKPLMIKGKFYGTVQATGDLHVGSHAEVHATVEAEVVLLRGKVFGNIAAASRVELFSTAVVDGDISSPEVVMESGCKFNGTCSMNSVEKEGEP